MVVRGGQTAGPFQLGVVRVDALVQGVFGERKELDVGPALLLGAADEYFIVGIYGYTSVASLA